MIRGGQHLHQVEAPVLIHSTSWHVVSAGFFQGLWAQAGQSKGDLRKTLPTHAGEAFPKCQKLVAVAGLAYLPRECVSLKILNLEQADLQQQM